VAAVWCQKFEPAIVDIAGVPPTLCTEKIHFVNDSESEQSLNIIGLNPCLGRIRPDMSLMI
jgi:hypothetical protein